MSVLSNILEAMKQAKDRQSAHHVSSGDRTVAIRYADPSYVIHFNGGGEHRNLNEDTAAKVALAYLGETETAKPKLTPPKRCSIPLGKGWSVSLSRDEVFPDDPGAGMPARLVGPFGKSASLWAAEEMGVVYDNDGYEHDIPQSVVNKLDEACQEANAYIEEVTAWLAAKKR